MDEQEISIQYVEKLQRLKNLDPDGIAAAEKVWFTKAVAVDPRGCGCLECLIHEYVPQEEWYSLATAADVHRLANGELRNNTNNYTPDLFSPWGYSDQSAKDYCRNLAELLEDLEERDNDYYNDLY